MATDLNRRLCQLERVGLERRIDDGELAEPPVIESNS
jgi:hypothetical protein